MLLRMAQATAPFLDSTTAWSRDLGKWLPSRDDGDFIVNLMRPVSEPGQFANWIAAPRIGIDNKPGDFEYVKIAA
jgi:benzoyl-CoA 2,3-dioxygenase component B